MKNVLALLWFFGIFLFMIISLPIIVLVFLPSTISNIFTSGFASANNGIMYFCVEALLIGITMVVPAFRIIFKKLPWLYSYCMLLLIDLLILAIFEIILNYGFESVNNTRHFIFTMIGIIQMIVSRIFMCFYFKKRQCILSGGEFIES